MPFLNEQSYRIQQGGIWKIFRRSFLWSWIFCRSSFLVSRNKQNKSSVFLFFAIVISLGLECELKGRGFGLIFKSRILVSRLKWSLHWADGWRRKLENQTKIKQEHSQWRGKKTISDTRPISGRLRVGRSSHAVGMGQHVGGRELWSGWTGAVMLKNRYFTSFNFSRYVIFRQTDGQTDIRTYALIESLAKRLKTEEKKHYDDPKCFRWALLKKRKTRRTGWRFYVTGPCGGWDLLKRVA